MRAFAPVILLGSLPLLIAANPAYKVTTFAELLALARREPGMVPFSTGGMGSPAHREVARVVALPEIRERLLAAGVEPGTSTPEQLAAELRSDLARWGPIVKRLGVKVQ